MCCAGVNAVLDWRPQIWTVSVITAWQGPCLPGGPTQPGFTRGLERTADDQALSSPSAPKASGGSIHRGCVDKVQLRKVAILSC